MAHVLIGCAEALPAPEVVFSLLAAGHDVSAFGLRAGLPLARLPLRSFLTIPDPGRDAAAAAAAIRDTMNAHAAPDLLLPLDDTGLWLSGAALGDEDRRIAGARGDAARLALDKSGQIEAARAAGLFVPETQLLQQPGDILDGDIRLPAIAKPVDAARLQDGRLVKNGVAYLITSADIDRFRATGEAAGRFLVQPLVAGAGEGLFGFATADGVLAWSAHRRVRMMNPHGSGSSACRAVAPDPALLAPVETFLARIDWRGPFMMEFLRDPEGKPWFMELNGRMWGSMALARRQGLEYPAWAVAAALDPGFHPPTTGMASGIPDQVHRDLGRDLLHLLFVLRGPKSAFHRAGWPGFWKSLRAVLAPAPPKAFYHYDPAHPRFFLRQALWTVWRGLRR
jgi:hypothetical protein